MDKFYLGSKSPRRAELLKLIHIPFAQLDFDFEEIVKENEKPRDYSIRITQEKLDVAFAYLESQHMPIYPVICADTEVVVNEEIYGKPQNYEHAFSMLKSYSGCVHQVITSVGVKYNDFCQIKTNETWVYFDEMTDDDIHRYLALNEYQDKAGGYGIKSYLAQFIRKIDGCYYSVMGLPLNTLKQVLNALRSHVL